MRKLLCTELIDLEAVSDAVYDLVGQNQAVVCMGPLEVRCESDLAGLLTSFNQFARRDTNEDIDFYIEHHSLDGLAVALEYADGTVTHCIAARELDLSPLEAEIIFHALESVANAYADTVA